VWIFGGINFFIFGTLSLVFTVKAYIGNSSSDVNNVIEEMKKVFPEVSVNPEQLKVAMLIQIVLATIFLISGYGLILRKEWGRKVTLYFSFFTVAVAFIAALLNSALITQAIVQITYPGILIIYFTNKKVEKFFLPPQPEETEKKKITD